MGYSAAAALLVFSLLAQFTGSVVVAINASRAHVMAAVTTLSSVLVMQTFAYGFTTDVAFLVRSVAVVGSLFMLLAKDLKAKMREQRCFDGGFVLGPSRSCSLTCTQLMSRLLVIFLYFSLLSTHSWTRVAMCAIMAAPVAMIALGYKAKAAAASFAAILLLENITMNSFFLLPTHHPERDFQKYYFFQTLTVVGGLLVLSEIGAGELSIDAKREI